MSTADAPPRAPAPPHALTHPRALPPSPFRSGAGRRITLDPQVPLRVFHLARRLTLAVVSIAWLHTAGDAARRRLTSRHLTAREAAYAASLPLPSRRCEWLAGRLAVKHSVCAHQLRQRGHLVTNREVRVDAIPDGMRAGKPVVDAPVEVGLSHSADLAVAVCGPHAVGVDLEHRREVPPLLAELLTAEGEPHSADPERRLLAAMPLPLRWACKEAVLKHYGFGLRVDACEVALTGWRPDGRFSWRAGVGLLRHAPAAEGGLKESWAFEIDGYYLAVVST
ncbi:4'-phosphopantetheinyl transferase family protein [Streptomyces smyrnaeus]|uniref:4'-phosphopantetheinyl transferase family protein n=1 Tax=Streptomyces smyrnaeus TaxID=1387713 RepID=UPI0034014EAE